MNYNILLCPFLQFIFLLFGDYFPFARLSFAFCCTFYPISDDKKHVMTKTIWEIHNKNLLQIILFFGFPFSARFFFVYCFWWFMLFIVLKFICYLVHWILRMSDDWLGDYGRLSRTCLAEELMMTFWRNFIENLWGSQFQLSLRTL